MTITTTTITITEGIEGEEAYLVTCLTLTRRRQVTASVCVYASAVKLL
jgi:hypothetical protein